MLGRAEGESFGKFLLLMGLEKKFCFLYIKANFNQINDIWFFFSPEARGDEGGSPGLENKGVGGG